MALDLAKYNERAPGAVRTFWATHLAANEPQPGETAAGRGQQPGTPDSESMVGFENLITDVVLANGLAKASVHVERPVCTVPGHFWSTELWNMLVVNSGRLVAAVDFQSYAGQMSDRTFRSTTKKAIGGAVDLWAAYRANGFGEVSHPFVGRLMLLEDSEETRSPVKDAEPHLSVFPEFDGASYVQRCEILCRKLARDRLYTSACLLVSRRAAASTGEYSEVSEISSLRRFAIQFAARIAVEAAWNQSRP